MSFPSLSAAVVQFTAAAVVGAAGLVFAVGAVSEISVFAVNRKIGEDAEIDLSLDGSDGYKLTEHVSMEGDDLKAGNSINEPDKVTPVEKSVDGGVVLTGGSWNYLKFKKQA